MWKEKLQDTAASHHISLPPFCIMYDLQNQSYHGTTI